MIPEERFADALEAFTLLCDRAIEALDVHRAARAGEVGGDHAVAEAGASGVCLVSSLSSPDFGIVFSWSLELVDDTQTPTVPEPGTLALLGAGLTALGVVRRNTYTSALKVRCRPPFPHD